MNLNKSFIYTLIFSSLSINLFSEIDPTAKLFKGINNNSFIEVQQAIKEGAKISAINPATDKTVLYEAIQNYYNKSKKSFGLRLTAGIALGTGSAVGLAFPALASYVHFTTGLEESSIAGTIIFSVTSLLASAAAAAGSAKYIKSSIHARAQIRRALSILSLIYKNMLKQKIKPDQESMELIEKLTPQLDKVVS